MSLIEKKYRRLVKKLSFVNSEYEYVVETLKDAHIEFNNYYNDYCAKNKVPVQDLEEKNKTKLEKVYPKAEQQTNEEGLVKMKNQEADAKPIDKDLQKMYRKAAVKVHPDKFSNMEETPEIKSKIEMFKSLAASYDERKWGDFLDICEKLDILPSRYSKIMEIIKKEIELLNKKISQHKNQFSWRFFECEEDNICKDNVMKDFLFQLFNYKVQESIIRI